MPYLVGKYGNPHSRTHTFGWETETAITEAREVGYYGYASGGRAMLTLALALLSLQHIGNLIGASQKEIIFTSGATESNNMAIKGIARFYKDKKRHIITTQTEHKCVLDSCRAMEAEGFEVSPSPGRMLVTCGPHALSRVRRSPICRCSPPASSTWNSWSAPSAPGRPRWCPSWA